MGNKKAEKPGSGFAEASIRPVRAPHMEDRLLAMLGRIQEEQHTLLEQQRKILSELADIKVQQKKMQQEMEGDLDAVDMLVSRNGLIQ